MNPAELTQSLKQEAVRVGFQLTGACAAVTPTGYSDFLKWLEAGYAGEMHYLEERQAAYEHPEGVMPGVKSLLMGSVIRENRIDYRPRRPIIDKVDKIATMQ